MTEKIVTLFKTRWKIIVPALVALVAIAVYYTYSSDVAAKENEARVKALAQKSKPKTETQEGLDTLLMEQQGSLREKYGTPKEGFIWDIDGTLLSLGNRKAKPEDVVYTYLRALSTLDFSTAEFNSRRSSVTNSYSTFFDVDSSSSVDYKEKFQRNLYKQSLLSLQVKEVSRSANFSSNKQVFTVKASMLDLSNKEFWAKDRPEIFEKIKTYRSMEEDPTKADTFLYDYVSTAYEEAVASLSSDRGIATRVPMKDVKFDLTLQKFPAQNSGYLVSIDKDLDLLCKNAEGTSIVDYIKTLYQDQLYQ